MILNKNIFSHTCSTSLTERKEDNKGKDNSTKDTKLNSEEVAKKIKNLKKKLRQIDELQAKVDNGELKELTIEQNEKLARRGAILDEIKELESS